MKYFLLTCTEDGTSIAEVDPAQLARDLEDTTEGAHVFLASVPRQDKGYWMNVPDGAAILIKGEIVAPEATTRVTAWKIP